MVKRKYVEIVILLVCGIALVFASSGCRKREPQETTEEPVVEPTDKGVTVEPPDKGVTIEPPDKGVTIQPPDKKVPLPPAKIYVIEPLVGIDKVRFGMTVDQMKEILGEPRRSRQVLHEYRDAGFAILTIKENTVTMIACGDRRRPDSPLIRNCTCKTTKDITMGSSREEIVSAYGEPSSTDQSPDGAIILRYGSLNAEFLLRDDKVVYMLFRSKTFMAPIK